MKKIIHKGSLNHLKRGFFAKRNLLAPLSFSRATSQLLNYSTNAEATADIIQTPNNSTLFFSESSCSKEFHQENFNCQKLLKIIANKLKTHDKPFENVMVVAVQHVLGTTVDMFKVLHKLGLSRVIIGGKSYSTHEPCVAELKKMGYIFVEAPNQLGYGRFDACMQETVSKIWSIALEEMQKKRVDLLIILDDGGDLLLSTPGKLFNGISYKPKRFIGIEQTRGGSNHRCFNGIPFPIINVAGSCIKTAIEYPGVAEIVASKVIQEIQKTPEVELSKKPIIGVIGNGTMGQAVISKFLDAGYLVLVHDRVNKIKNKKVIWQNDIPSLISNADVIIGCTGTDITAESNNLSAVLNNIKPKYFVSASSKDIEFSTLLIHIQEQKKRLEQTPNPLRDIEYINPDNPANEKIVILRGGFPINFDNKLHSLAPEKIWPTRAALMSACLMAVNAYHAALIKSPDVLKLDVSAQYLILKAYQYLNPADPVVQPFKAMSLEAAKNFILKNSDGNELQSSLSSEEALVSVNNEALKM